MLYLNELKPHPSIKQFEIFKPFGYTPKDVIDEIITKTKCKKATFNGRLDPMACGCMLVYLDEACYLSKLDLNLGKIYRFKMALGLESSSCDLLGYPKFCKNNDECIIYKMESKINSFLNQLQQSYIQTLPHLSSFRVCNQEGIKQPLWWWDKNNRLSEIIVPSFERKLYDFRVNTLSYVPLRKIVETAIDRISKINLKHIFNQLEIIAEWNKLLNTEDEVAVLELQVSVSSGFYVRKLVEDIGHYLSVKTITVEIERLSYFSNT